MKAEDKNKKLVEVIMNPVRQRIAQYLLIHKTGTTGEMSQELSDIPPASLYRHVKVLLDAGLIQVVAEKKVRGVLEKTYRLVQNPVEEVNNNDISMIFQTGLLSLLTTFQTYFSKEDVDPQKDMLSISTSTLMLSDVEFLELLKKISGIFNEAIYNTANEFRKPRSITFISAPTRGTDTK